MDDLDDWLDYIGEHIDKIEWDAEHRRWKISNDFLKVTGTPLEHALDKFEREWSAMNE